MNATVIIPAYQAAAFIERCLDSVLLQGEAVAEVFVVDNASTDGTGAVVERWLARHDLPTWHLLHEPTPGACAARNAPLERVSHHWIQFLDACVENTVDLVRRVTGNAELKNCDGLEVSEPSRAKETFHEDCRVKGCKRAQRCYFIAKGNPVVTALNSPNFFTCDG